MLYKLLPRWIRKWYWVKVRRKNFVELIDETGDFFDLTPYVKNVSLNR